ncbi:hypothetical protein [Bacillus fungorum]|uniref:hypothetical protein n=1 Tax=Bacillus fungorum TaxID=2039284 RepID=UPI001FEB6E6A|nr:hypothetical protein [Bacillus fungorum]
MSFVWPTLAFMFSRNRYLSNAKAFMGEARKRKEMNELKCAYMVQIYLKKIHAALFYTVQHPVSVLSRLFQDISKNGRKARRYKKRTPFEILGLIGKSTDQLPMAS